jgi:hypothetical protein
MMHERAAWDDYFTGSPTLLQTTEFTSRKNPSDASLYVLNCLFNTFTSGYTGGALYCTSVTSFLIEFSSFFSCKTSSDGGAIYFTNGGGQSVLYGVCGYDCCTTNSIDYQFAYIVVNNAISSKNCVNYSSIVRCVNENSSYILYLYYGKNFCPSVNMSLNKCYYRSGICCCPSDDSNYAASSLTYSSFIDNHAAGHNCITFDTSGSKFEIKSCNIIRNTQGSLGSEGTIYTNGNLIIEDSCILENTATKTFHVSSSSYSITLSDCTVDSTSNNGYLTIRNTVPKSFILGLNHMSTENCHSEYDSAGYLTPIIQTPSSSRKQKLCTCGKNFYQPQLSEYFLFP